MSSGPRAALINTIIQNTKNLVDTMWRFYTWFRKCKYFMLFKNMSHSICYHMLHFMNEINQHSLFLSFEIKRKNNFYYPIFVLFTSSQKNNLQKWFQSKDSPNDVFSREIAILVTKDFNYGSLIAQFAPIPLKLFWLVIKGTSGMAFFLNSTTLCSISCFILEVCISEIPRL